MTVTATDLDGAVTYSIPGSISADDGLFTITSGGALTFTTAPNFEANGSAAGNNTYVVNVRATDTVMSGTTDQIITVTVTNVNEAPVIGLAAGALTTVAENVASGTAIVDTFTATDVDATTTLTYTLTGTDADSFTIVAGTGVVSWAVSPNFEVKASYSFNVVATDNGAGTLFDTHAYTIAITDVNEPAPVFFFSSGPAPMVSQTALGVVPAVTTVQLTKTTTLSTTGGSGSGAVTYATSTPTICSITSAGVVSAVAVGTCSVTATKASDGSSYLAATSVPVTITMSNSDALAAAAALQAAADKVIADKAAADKVIADKAAADKVIADKAAADKAAADKAAADKAAADKAAADKAAADKAAADKAAADKAAADKVIADKAAADKAAADKVIADKAAADKVIADKAAADKAASEGGGGSSIDNSLINSIKYSTNKSKITTIKIDLADEYGDLLVDVSVKTTVLVKGKKVTKYVTIGQVTLNEIGQGSIKTNKAKIIIKARDVIRVSFGGITIKTITVK